MNAANQTDDLAAVALLDEPVRRRLYEWVVAQGKPVGREEAARTLGITRSLAAFHLDRLTEAGLLEAGYQRLTGRTGPGAGRPARVYHRAERDIAVNLPRTPLRAGRGRFSRPRYNRLATERRPTELVAAAHDAGERQTVGGSMDVSARACSSSAGYEPVDEEGTIRLRNCPFDALVEEHRPLVCGTNLALAQGILDGLGDAGADFSAAP